MTSKNLFQEFIRQSKRTFEPKEALMPARKRPGTLRVYLTLIKGYRSAFGKIFLAACLTEVLYLAVPFTTRYIIDGVLMQSNLTTAVRQRLLITIGLILLGTLVIAQAVDFWRRFYTSLVNGRFVRSIRLRLFTHLMHLPLSKIHDIKTGGIVSRLTSDAENLTGLLQMALISPGVAFLRIMITFVILIQWHLPLALIASGFIPPLVYISLWYILRIRPIYKSVSSDRSAQDARTSEVFSGIRAIKAYQMQGVERARYNLGQALMFRKNIFASLKESAVDGIWNFLIPATSLLIMVFGGIYFLRGEASIGDLVAFQMYSGMLLYPVWRMVFSLSQIQKSLASLDRVIDMFNEEPEVESGNLEFPRHLAQIAFSDVSYEYRDGQPVLNHVSFTLEPSKIYAIVGESGVGKTTVIDLLCRFYTPQSGKITINAGDIRDIDLKAYRRNISIVTQDAILFDGTVRENLLTGDDRITEKDLNAILKASDTTEFIHNLPQGLDTLVGERGFKLSGGQKHRLTLARALAKGAPILILDEATAHLDTLSEQRIRGHLRRLKKNRVVIIITHRLSTVQHADQILVLGGGGIEAIGTHAALLRKSKTYRKLSQAQ
jgi:ATP-binding cassette, subfamily B, bacterial